MSDLHPPPPDPPTNGSSNPSADPTSPSPLGPIPTPTAAPSSSAAVPTTTTTAKRQRRPSVRLGDIGEQPAASDAFIRRSKHLKLPPPLGPTPSSSSKNPPLSLKPRSQSHHLDPLPHSPDAHNPLSSSLLRRPNPNPNHNKSRRVRRSRSAWASSSSKPADEEEDEGFRSEFDDLRRDRDDSLSPSDRDHLDGGGRDWPADDNLDNGTLGMDEVGGVRSWLNRLGLGRYAPVFEIHEVDDEVLPLLTLEDLKDMGINAVGSRRKMFWAIQKLKKNFYLNKDE